MKRIKTSWMVMGLALIAGMLVARLTTAAYAQGGFGVVSGTVLDPTGKPYPGVEIIAKNQESGQTFDVKTDGKGHYSMAGMPGGTYTVDLKDKDKIVYQTGFKLAGGTSPVFDVNLKEIFEKDKGANAEAEAKRAEAEKAFQSLTNRYENLYYTGILHERRAKAQMNAQYAPHSLAPLFHEAMRCFAEAEKIRPEGNDDTILRWNRCARLLQTRPEFDAEQEPAGFDACDT